MERDSSRAFDYEKVYEFGSRVFVFLLMVLGYRPKLKRNPKKFEAFVTTFYPKYKI